MRLLLYALVIALAFTPVAAASTESSGTTTSSSTSSGDTSSGVTLGPDPSGCRPYCTSSG